MANTGPIPKRSEERRRRNARTEAGESTDVDTLEVDDDLVEAPPVNEDWDPLVQRFYTSVVDSAFTRFYEPSDWMVLQVTCESLSRDLGEQFLGIAEKTGEALYGVIPLKGASLTAYAKIWSSLMLTEGDRRRMRLEIERKSAQADLPATDEDVVAERGHLFAVK